MGGDYNTITAASALTAAGVDAGGGNGVMLPQLNSGIPPPVKFPVEYNHP